MIYSKIDIQTQDLSSGDKSYSTRLTLGAHIGSLSADQATAADVGKDVIVFDVPFTEVTGAISTSDRVVWLSKAYTVDRVDITSRPGRVLIVASRSKQ